MRFIPACAGNSSALGLARVPRSVHPRVCGELTTSTSKGYGAIGSSPRVRGTQMGHDLPPELLRFIPACAGNSRTQVQVALLHPVHPRVCGELRKLRAKESAEIGSSPRVRGTPHSWQHQSVRVRFIPACAGNSRGHRAYRADGPVHPRVCGELHIVTVRANGVDGSSPRVRGTRRLRVFSDPVFRFIPACAGNSLASATLSTARTVHPRVCGELGSCASRHPPTGGSSPRVRGTLPQQH